MKHLFILFLTPFIFISCFSQLNVDSLWAIWQNDKEQLEKLEAGFILVEEYYKDYDYALADSLADEMLNIAIALKLEDQEREAKYLNILLHYKENPQQYIQELEDLLGTLSQSDNPNLEAKIYRILGEANYRLSNYTQSLEAFQKSIQLTEDLNDSKGTAQSLTGIGWIYFRLKDYLKARQYYEESLDLLAIQPDSISIWHATNGLGGTYQKLMDFDTALYYEEKCLHLAKRLGFDYGIATSLNNIGGNYKIHGENEEALSYFYKSLATRETLEGYHPLEKTHTAIKIAETYLAMKNYPEAINWCQKAQSVYGLNGNIRMTRDLYDCLYEAFKASGQYKEAVLAQENWREAVNQMQADEVIKHLQLSEFTKQVFIDSLNSAEKERLAEEAYQKELRQGIQNRNIAIGSGLFFLLLAAGFYSRWRYVRKTKAIVEKEKDRSNNLLLNILPADIAEELKIHGKAEARDFELVSILFTDFKGFTAASEKLSAQDLVAEINVCFQAFDGIVAKYRVEKIKTIGDAYMAAGGLPIPNDLSVKNTVLAALEMQAFISKRKVAMDAEGRSSFEMRVGIHTGPVVAGIVGVKKFQYDIWGDTVNTASRMESNGEIGKVNISQATYNTLKDDSEFSFESRGKIEAKGKGEIEMYFVLKK